MNHKVVFDGIEHMARSALKMKRLTAFGRETAFQRRSRQLQDRLYELLRACECGDVQRIALLVRSIDPSFPEASAQKSFEKAVQNFTVRAVASSVERKQLASIKVLRQACRENWDFLADDGRPLHDHILDVALRHSLSWVIFVVVCLVIDSEDWNPPAENNFVLLACRTENDQILEKVLGNERFAQEAQPVQWQTAIFESAINCRIVSLGHLARKAKTLDDANLVLQSACKAGAISIVQLILKKPDLYIDRFGEAALCTACSHGRTEVVKFLLDDKRFKLCANAKALLNARKSPEITELLLESGVLQEVSSTEFDQCLLEASKWNVHVVKLLLDSERCPASGIGGDVMENLCRNRPTFPSSDIGAKIEAVIERLLQDELLEFVNPPENLLVFTITARNKQRLEKLLADPRIKVAQDLGTRIVAWACAIGDVEILRFLLQHSQVVFERVAVWSNCDRFCNRKSLKILLKDPRLEPSADALLIAAKAGNVVACETLVLGGWLHPNSIDDAGDDDALHAALMSTHPRKEEVICVLLRKKDLRFERYFLQDDQVHAHTLNRLIKRLVDQAVRRASEMLALLKSECLPVFGVLFIEICALAFGRDIIVPVGKKHDLHIVFCSQLLTSLVATS